MYAALLFLSNIHKKGMMERDSILTYHQATFDLIGEKPVTSSKAIEAIARFEHIKGLSLLASVKEWYTLASAQNILSRYPPAGAIRGAEQLGGPESYWFNGVFHEIDLLKQGLLLIMAEIQNICFWAIQLNGEDDPPVVVSKELKPFATWHLCAETFSVFVYTCVWDSLVINPEDQMFGWKESLLPTELDFLHERFEEGPRTYTFPGAVNYRLFSGNQRILIQVSERQASWYFAADSDEALKRLVEQVLQCETLKRDLYLDRNGLTDWEFMFPDENEKL